MFANQIRCTVVFCAQLSTLTTETPCVFRGSTCSTLVYWEASQGFPRGVGTCWFNTNLAALLRIQLVSSQHDIGKNAGWGKTCVKYCQVIHYYVTIWFYILHIIRIHQLYIYIYVYIHVHIMILTEKIEEWFEWHLQRAQIILSNENIFWEAQVPQWTLANILPFCCYPGYRCRIALVKSEKIYDMSKAHFLLQR